jgi:glycosyltransferase involved in cell wall biosynthesis
VKLAVVTQRYGADVSGGAELHARFVAEHLAAHHAVEVITTCARDYVTWANDLPPGVDNVNGLTVRRFPVSRARDPRDFGRRSALVFERQHSVADELAWLESEGPTSPRLVRYVAATRDEFDFFIFFSYRYYHAFHGARAVPHRAVLVPTAERDPAVALSIFAPLFRGVRATMFNSFEERAMIRALSGSDDLPGVVVGVGSEVPARAEPGRARREFGLDGPFVVYVGRIDENKGCKELFAHFQRYVWTRRSPLTLVLVGSPLLAIPSHARIRHLGVLDDRDKFDVMAAAEALIMPSQFESLSIVALEAWALGRPVLANGSCDVLRGQCRRSNAGLYYESYEEFAETLHVLETNRNLREVLGHNGREYYRRHYSWPVIEGKYLDMLSRLADEDRQGLRQRGMDPLPGWLARRRRSLPPARQVLDGIPAGPAIAATRPAGHQAARRRHA